MRNTVVRAGIVNKATGCNSKPAILIECPHVWSKAVLAPASTSYPQNTRDGPGVGLTRQVAGVVDGPGGVVEEHAHQALLHVRQPPHALTRWGAGLAGFSSDVSPPTVAKDRS